MHRNEIFYALIYIDNHVLSCLISMLSAPSPLARPVAQRSPHACRHARSSEPLVRSLLAYQPTTARRISAEGVFARRNSPSRTPTRAVKLLQQVDRAQYFPWSLPSTPPSTRAVFASPTLLPCCCRHTPSLRKP